MLVSGMLPGVYAPRSPAGTVLHRVVRIHLDRFLGETAAATDGSGVPRFIEREFRDFLGCGALGRGFCRVRCDACRFERLAALTPRPRINLVLYHGILAPRAKCRAAAVAYGREDAAAPGRRRDDRRSGGRSGANGHPRGG